MFTNCSRFIRSLLWLYLSLLWSGPSSAVETEADARTSIRTSAVELWLARDYRALDRLGLTYMRADARTPSGLWKSGLFVGELQTQVTADLDEQGWSNYMSQVIKAWPATSPDSPFAHIQVASALMQRAWYSRGHGYANTVTAEGWRLFQRNLEEARTYLESTKAISSQESTWYTHMLQIAVWQQWPEAKLRTLLDQAMKQNPEFFPNYFAALDYYSPKWGGSAERIESFSSEISNFLGGDRGDEVYARVYWAAADSHFNRSLAGTRVNCQRMLRGMRSIAKVFRDPWNVNRFAAFSVECGSRADAKQYFEQIGDSPLLSLWGGSRATFERFRDWASK